VGPERILVLAGAQQGLDLVARCLIDPGDVVIMDRPGYLGAIQVFRAAGARLVGWDAAGGDIDQLEDVLVRYRPKFLYTTPSFGNPTGRTLPRTARHDLLRMAARYHLPIVEDDPYSELYFEQQPPPSLWELDERQLVIHIGTFSKTLAAGLRLGWLVAADAVVDQLTFIKARNDLFTSTPTQLVVTELLTSRFYDTHLKTLRAEHARRYEALVSALRRSLSPGVLAWQTVEGGLYLWCRLQQPIDARLLLQQALAAGVSFVPGESFYGDGCGRYELRLCFAAATPVAIEEAVHRLARIFQPASLALLREVDGTRPLI
jgi:DNA-binding transcriptional MocR family regulator